MIQIKPQFLLFYIQIERMDRGLSQLTTLNLEKLREQIKNKLAGPTQGSTIAQMMTDQIMAQFCVQISSVQQVSF